MDRMLGKLGKRKNPAAKALADKRYQKRIVPDKTKYTRKAWHDMAGEWRNDT